VGYIRKWSSSNISCMVVETFNDPLSLFNKIVWMKAVANISNFYIQVESTNEVQALYPLDAEFTRPSWVFGNSSYAFIEHKGQNNNIACTYRFLLYFLPMYCTCAIRPFRNVVKNVTYFYLNMLLLHL